MVPAIVITAVVSYLLGNLNGAVVVSHLIAHEDVRTKGSGNAGLTNFTRNYGSHTSIFVIAIDMGKAILSCLLGGWLLGRCRRQRPPARPSAANSRKRIYIEERFSRISA